MVIESDTRGKVQAVPSIIIQSSDENYEAQASDVFLREVTDGIKLGRKLLHDSSVVRMPKADPTVSAAAFLSQYFLVIYLKFRVIN